MPKLIDYYSFWSRGIELYPLLNENWLGGVFMFGGLWLFFFCKTFVSGIFPPLPWVFFFFSRSIKDNCRQDYFEWMGGGVRRSSTALFKEVEYPYNKKQIIFLVFINTNRQRWAQQKIYILCTVHSLISQPSCPLESINHLLTRRRV